MREVTVQPPARSTGVTEARTAPGDIEAGRTTEDLRGGATAGSLAEDAESVRLCCMADSIGAAWLTPSAYVHRPGEVSTTPRRVTASATRR
jgi:hypothetical protein